MYLTLIILPLLGSMASGFFGRKIGITGSHFITCGCVIITTILSFVAFMEVGFNNSPVSIHLFKWLDSESLNVLWGFNFDSLTVSMLIPVLVVSSLVHIYSIEYMSHDPHNQRFFSYLSLFTFMMIILVTANNYLLMFVGWEGVGVCSYLLVSFWFTRIAANQSSLAAFLTNRVGDCLLTVGMFALLWSFGNIDYNTVFSIAPYINENVITIIGICLLIGAMAKSSQVGLHIWLPMAMEGPTPVSALIHAATMVTAGVYLLMRSSPLLEYSSTVLICCLWLGALTTVFSSLIGLFQQDIKKVIAYSTMSQLGMMVIAIGLSSYNVALFHLVNHAFYKALLFLGAGAVIHAVSDNQDFRKFGGLRHLLPLTYSVMLIASLSLVAFPFMTGFYSKDFILESAYGQFTFSGTAVYYIASIGAMFTTLYSIKVLYLTFLSNPFGPVTNYINAHEGKIFMSLPLIILAVFSIFFGYITKDLFIGLGSNFFVDNSIFIHPNNEIMMDTEFAVPTFYKLLPLFFTITLTIISLIFSELMPKSLLLFKFTNLGNILFGFFNQRFLVELLYNKFIVNFVFKLGGQTTKNLDKGSVELIGPHGLEILLLKLSKSLGALELNIVTTYALYITIGLIAFILIVYLGFYSVNLLMLLIFSSFVNINYISTNKVISASFKNFFAFLFDRKTWVAVFIMLIISILSRMFFIECNLGFILVSLSWLSLSGLSLSGLYDIWVFFMTSVKEFCSMKVVDLKWLKQLGTIIHVDENGFIILEIGGKKDTPGIKDSLYMTPDNVSDDIPAGAKGTPGSYPDYEKKVHHIVTYAPGSGSSSISNYNNELANPIIRCNTIPFTERDHYCYNVSQRIRKHLVPTLRGFNDAEFTAMETLDKNRSKCVSTVLDNIKRRNMDAYNELFRYTNSVRVSVRNRITNDTYREYIEHKWANNNNNSNNNN